MTTVGSLDMGGASTQLAIELNDAESEFIEQGENVTLFEVDLFGQSYTVFSESFLCFGNDQAFNRYRYMLIKVMLCILTN